MNPYLCENSIMALAWSPDSTQIALLFDNGHLTIFDIHGKTIKECSLKECKLVACDIDWSKVTNCLGVPATHSAVKLHEAENSDTTAVEEITLEDYITKIHPRKPLIADKVAWSSSTAKLAITFCDIGDGADSSKKYPSWCLSKNGQKNTFNIRFTNFRRIEQGYSANHD